jgi:hypothetical protein
LFYLALLIQLLLVLVEQVVLAQPRKGKLHPELVGLILFLAQLIHLGAGEVDRLLVQLSQVGREVGLAALPLQGLPEQLARVTKAETLQMEVVVEVGLALLVVMELHRFRREELLQQVARVLRLLLLEPVLREEGEVAHLEITGEQRPPLVGLGVAELGQPFKAQTALLELLIQEVVVVALLLEVPKAMVARAALELL